MVDAEAGLLFEECCVYDAGGEVRGIVGEADGDPLLPLGLALLKDGCNVEDGGLGEHAGAGGADAGVGGEGEVGAFVLEGVEGDRLHHVEAGGVGDFGNDRGGLVAVDFLAEGEHHEDVILHTFNPAVAGNSEVSGGEVGGAEEERSPPLPRRRFTPSNPDEAT